MYKKVYSDYKCVFNNCVFAYKNNHKTTVSVYTDITHFSAKWTRNYDECCKGVKICVCEAVAFMT